MGKHGIKEHMAYTDGIMIWICDHIIVFQKRRTSNEAVCFRESILWHYHYDLIGYWLKDKNCILKKEAEAIGRIFQWFLSFCYVYEKILRMS